MSATTPSPQQPEPLSLPPEDFAERELPLLLVPSQQPLYLPHQLHDMANAVDSFLEEQQKQKPSSQLADRIQQSPAEIQEILQRVFENNNPTIPQLIDILSQPEHLVAVSETDPLAAARLRGVQVKHNLLHDDGTPLNSAGVASLLGISRQAVDKRRKKGQLLAVSLGKRGYYYPLCQFYRGQILPGLEPVLTALADSDPWTHLMWLKTGDARLASQTPIACLQKGEIDRVVFAAQCYGQPNPA